MKNTIRIERAKENISQAYLAKKVGCSKQTIYLIENDLMTPKTDLALRIAGYFQLPVEDIFEFKD